MIAARRTHRLEKRAIELRAKGVEVLPVACDVSDREAVHALVDQTLDTFGRLDGLVNHAGITEVIAATEEPLAGARVRPPSRSSRRHTNARSRDSASLHQPEYQNACEPKQRRVGFGDHHAAGLAMIAGVLVAIVTHLAESLLYDAVSAKFCDALGRTAVLAEPVSVVALFVSIDDSGSTTGNRDACTAVRAAVDSDWASGKLDLDANPREGSRKVGLSAS